MPGKVYIKTFGCQMNEYDSSRMLDVLRVSHGMEATDRPEEADVLLLNTCSIREKAQEKVFSHLGIWRELKEQRPGVLIGVGGCVASQEADAFAPAGRPSSTWCSARRRCIGLPGFIDEIRARGRAVVDVSFPEIEKFDRLPEPRADGPTAFVSIMEGCSKYCSFCVVPYTRGEEVSRPLDDVVGRSRRACSAGRA
jgi:tRNA-2-methylthio-N6-dimethylallyladenosine synthase